MATEIGDGFAIAEEHVAGGGGWGGFAAIEGEGFAVWGADEEEHAAAEAGVVGVGDAEDEGGGDGTVDGIATGGDGVVGGVSGERVRGGGGAARGGGGGGIAEASGEWEGAGGGEEAAAGIHGVRMGDVGFSVDGERSGGDGGLRWRGRRRGVLGRRKEEACGV